jgi:hypothetical protein
MFCFVGVPGGRQAEFVKSGEPSGLFSGALPAYNESSNVPEKLAEYIFDSAEIDGIRAFKESFNAKSQCVTIPEGSHSRADCPVLPRHYARQSPAPQKGGIPWPHLRGR